MRLKGKVAVITGCGSGIGRAAAKAFAKEGAKVVATDINEKGLNETVADIRKEGGEVTSMVMDAGKLPDNKKMIDLAIQKYGRIDILYSNAGVAGESLADTTEEKWRRTLDINLTGPYFAATYAIPYMKKQGGGIMLFTGSTGAMRASGRSPSYTATKGAIVMLARALAKILAKDNIRVNAICPGSVETGLSDAFAGWPKTEEEKKKAQATRLAHIPMGRQARPEELAAVAVFMCSDDASFVDGAAWLVDGGMVA